MRIIIIILTLVTVPFISSSKELNIQFNENVELLGLAYFLIYEGDGIETAITDLGDSIVPKKEWHSYGYNFYRKYKDHAQSKSLAEALTVAEHLWIDYIINLLLQVDDAPYAVLTDKVDPRVYIRFSKSRNPEEARRNVEIFLKGFNKFYREVNFDQYLKESSHYYEAALQQVKENIKARGFITHLENYHRKSFKGYNLIPSLTIPKGMGFGIRYRNEIYNVFGALDWQRINDLKKLDMGFNHEIRMRELSIHEFGHSFVNQVLDTLPEGLVQPTKELFKPIQNAMANQGYMQWEACLEEHFVRTIEILIAEKYYPKEAERLWESYFDDRKFIYIPVIYPILNEFGEGKYASFNEAALEAIEKLKMYDRSNE